MLLAARGEMVAWWFGINSTPTGIAGFQTSSVTCDTIRFGSTWVRYVDECIMIHDDTCIIYIYMIDA